jgi:hypothetical protein
MHQTQHSGLWIIRKYFTAQIKYEESSYKTQHNEALLRGEIDPVHDMKAYRWSSSTTPLILNLDIKKR